MKIRSPWLIQTVAFAGAAVLRAWLTTLRARVVSADGRTHPADPLRQRFIYAFWHESLLAPITRRVPVKALISQSADGELIAQVCRHLGIGVVRGSTTLGGVAGLLDMLRNAEPAHLIITPDGPRGPRRRLQAGVVFLASVTGLPVVPVGVGFTRAWRAPSWDRFAVPHPFSTVTGVLAEPQTVPPKLDGGQLEHYRLQVERALLDATCAAERWAQQLASRSWRTREADNRGLAWLTGPNRSPVSKDSTATVDVSCAP